MNVPKLRFKEFTEEWKIIKLDELYEFKNGINTDKTAYGKGVPLISVTDIINNNFITYNKIRGKIDINNKILINNSVEYGDILFQRSSETFAEIGTSNIYLDNKMVTFGGFVIRGKRKNNEIPLFINYELKSPDSRKKIIIKGAGAQHYNIGQEDLRQVSIFVPSKEEQTKIANFLSLLDKKIELQSKKIEDLKLYKKGLLMNLFKNRTCNKKLSQCFSFGKAGGTPKSTNQDYYNGNIPFLSISDMSKQGKYIFKTEKSITELGINNSSAWLVPKNSIIISMYASYGLVSINNIELSTSQAMFNIIITEDNSVEYIYYYLYYLYITNFYDSIVSTGTQPNLNAEQLKNLKIYIPPKAEQEKMSNKLIKFDNKLNLEILKLTKLQELKKGLMQNMFV